MLSSGVKCCRPWKCFLTFQSTFVFTTRQEFSKCTLAGSKNTAESLLARNLEHICCSQNIQLNGGIWVFLCSISQHCVCSHMDNFADMVITDCLSQILLPQNTSPHQIGLIKINDVIHCGLLKFHVEQYRAQVVFNEHPCHLRTD